jgi:hypothetical protein
MIKMHCKPFICFLVLFLLYNSLYSDWRQAVTVTIGTNVINPVVMDWGSSVTVNGTIYAYYQEWNYSDTVMTIGLMTTSATGTGTTWNDYKEIHCSNYSTTDTLHHRRFVGSWFNDPSTGRYDWEVMAPTVWYDASSKTFYLIYESHTLGGPYNNGWKDPNQGMRLASSTDGFNFKKLYTTSGPIFRCSEAKINGQDINIMGTAKIYKKDGKWYLFYHANTKRIIDGTTPDEKCLAIGTSLAPGKFTPVSFNPILPVIPNTWTTIATGQADVIFRNGIYFMVFEGGVAQDWQNGNGLEGGQYGRWGHGMAFSHDMIHWSRGMVTYGNDGSCTPLNPVLRAPVGGIRDHFPGFCYDAPRFIYVNGQDWVYHKGPQERGNEPGFSYDWKAKRTERYAINFTAYNYDYEVENGTYHGFGKKITGSEYTAWGVQSPYYSPVPVNNWGCLIYGPYHAFETGDYVAYFKVNHVKGSYGPFQNIPVIKIDVCSDYGNTILASREYYCSDLPTSGYTVLRLPYINTNASSQIEFRVWTYLQKSGSYYYPKSLDVDNITASKRFYRDYEAESSQYHALGAANGDGWEAYTTAGSGHLCYGPYTQEVEQGKNVAVFKLKIDDVSFNDPELLCIDVYTNNGGTKLAERWINRNEFKTNYTYQLFEVPFNNTSYTNTLEFRTWTRGWTYVKQDKVFVYYNE